MNELEQIWSAVQEAIRNSDRMSSSAYNLWFADLVFESLNSTEAVFSTSNTMKLQILKDRYLDILSKYLSDTIGYEPKIVLTSRSEEAAPVIQEVKPQNAPIQNESLSEINPEYTFDSFIVGDSNRFAHATALAVAEKPGYAYNPLMIYGPSGLGKTHLMCAIANKIAQDSPEKKIVYVKGDEFTNQLIEAMKKNSTISFREKYRQADVLMIDDIHFIAGKNSTQEEFFHTFNSLYEKHKQIIVTSDRPPKDMTTLEERIKSRLEAGLLADIGLPDYELRLAILKGKAEKIGLTLSDTVSTFLADNLHSNIRQIEGVIKKLRASQFVSDVPITVAFVKESIPEFLKDSENTSDVVSRIISMTALHFGVSEQELLGKSRQKEIKNARNIAMYIIKETTQLSLNDIGIMFNRDHSTVYSNIQAVKNDAQSDSILSLDIHDIMKEIQQ